MPYLQLKIEFPKINKTIESCSSISMSHQYGSHQSFSLEVNAYYKNNDERKNKIDNYKQYVGETIVLRVNEKNSAFTLFRGIVNRYEIAESKATHLSISLKGNGLSVLLQGNDRCRSFTEKSLTDIFIEVLKPYSALSTKNIAPSFKSTLPYITQYEESDFEFLQRLGATYGEWIYFDDQTVSVGKPNLTGEAIKLQFGKKLTYLTTNQQVIPIGEENYQYNYKKNELFSTNVSSLTIKGSEEQNFIKDISDKVYPEEPVNLITTTEFASNRELEAWLSIQKKMQLSATSTVTGISENPNLKVGQKVKINGAEYIIVSVAHAMEDNGNNYQNQFSAIPAQSAHPPALNTGYPVAHPQIATVVETKDDNKLGRVKVRFSWQNGNDTTPWTRVMIPYGSEEEGFYFIPEVGSTVMVDFENRDPDVPYVVGCFYNGSFKNGKWQNDKNEQKVIRTKGGNEITISDEQGKEEIKISNKDGKNMVTLSCNGDGTICLTSDKIVFDANTIEFKSRELTIETDKTKFKTKDMKMEASQLEISSDKAALSAKASMTIDGGAQAAMKAGIIKLN